MPALLRRFERVGKRVREKATVLEDDLRHRRVGRRDRLDQRVLLALRAVLQEQPNDFGMLRLATHGGAGRPGERRGAIERILDIDVGTVLPKHFYHLEVPAIPGVGEGWRTVAGLRGYVHALLEEVFHP